MAKPANGSQRPRSSAEGSEARPTRARDEATGRDQPVNRTGTGTARDNTQPKTPRGTGTAGRRGATGTSGRSAGTGTTRAGGAGAGAHGNGAATRTTGAGGVVGRRVGAGRDDWAARDVDGRRGGGTGTAERAYPVGKGDLRRPARRDAGAGRPVVSPSRQRMLRRRRRSVVLLLLLICTVLIGVDQFVGRADETTQAATTAADLTQAPGTGPGAPPGAAPRAAPGEPVLRPLVVPTTKPAPAKTTAGTAATTATAGSGFAYADTAGPVMGTAGTLRRFRVAVEKRSGQDAGRFAAVVDRLLGDPRSWIASGQLRLQRVPRAAAAEFTIWLASAETSERMCASGGLRTDGYTSCRLPGHVVINLDRWKSAIPDYRAPLAVYQAYAINHEVGHQLGHGHEACPGGGRPAPVMQQQTYGLKGCVANAWPYVDGKRYAGMAVR